MKKLNFAKALIDIMIYRIEGGIRYKLPFVVFILIAILQVNAQDLKCVQDVKYNTNETKVRLLPQNTTLADIHVYDIPDLRQTEKTKSHHEYIDKNGELHHDITLTNAVNCHEEWENLANRWEFDQRGLTSYYILPKSPKGQKQIINQFSYDSITGILYKINKQTVLSKGLLVNKVFPTNLKNELKNFNIPYTVIGAGIIFTMDSTTYTVYNENLPKTITKVTYSTGGPLPNSPPNPGDPDVIYTEIKLFDTEICGNYLLSSKTGITTDTLSNGLCSKQVVTTEYTDYQFKCCGFGLSPREESKPKNIENNTGLKIYPNPFNSGKLTVNLPDSFKDEEIVLSVYSIDGKLIKQFSSVTISGTKVYLPVDKYLNKQGFYTLKVMNKDRVLTKKFFFVK